MLAAAHPAVEQDRGRTLLLGAAAMTAQLPAADTADHFAAGCIDGRGRRRLRRLLAGRVLVTAATSAREEQRGRDGENGRTSVGHGRPSLAAPTPGGSGWPLPERQ